MQEQVVPANLKTQYLGAIPVAQIVESKTNPRKSFGELDELVESVKQMGVLTPVLVRRVDDAFRLIAGARRIRAAKKGGLFSVPAIEVDCSEEQALEIQLVENCQRKDVHPMEEAEGFERLIEIERGRGATDPIAEVARRIGKTRAHVLLRLKLLDLPEPAREAFLQGHMTAEHAAVITRLPDAETRERAWKIFENSDADYCGEATLTARAFAEQVEGEILLELTKAGFDTADANLVPGAGACGPCPKRTGNAPDLFGGVTGKGANLCTDPKCFKSKIDMAWFIKTEKAQAKGIEVLTPEKSAQIFRYGDHVVSNAYVDPDENSGGGQSYRKRVGKASADVERVVVRTPSGKAKELWKKSSVNKVIEAQKPKAQKEKEAKSKAEAKAAAEAEVQQEKLLEELVPMLLDKVASLKRQDFLELAVKIQYRTEMMWSIREILQRRGIGQREALLERDPGVLQSMIIEAAVADELDYNADEVVPLLAKAVGVDYKAELKRLAATKAAAAEPESKPAKKKGGKK